MRARLRCASARRGGPSTKMSLGVTASAPFIGVLRTRDGKPAHWREYQLTLAITQAAGPV